MKTCSIDNQTYEINEKDIIILKMGYAKIIQALYNYFFSLNKLVMR